ncbi:uncharacterized protein PHACADRAFT_257746 [Phanerochaete carnosa HHB-10118-sp]|uniref:Mitochondrial intermembrane space import and assembly protein 40 n=1 Tax=Phanerochaete carnosa (strain HHB-10118-sp) TaxID=650164 RepID=K5W596_PHACS|nr:uncharacterized protein PHACADRAFT_257746 [Phanerochaete carnosa HHB-10118-sp]EKM54124.1 hypothetical protein PHACADRAFT_257746 [Phanerochaete carnosa HHB-10118-sp]
MDALAAEAEAESQEAGSGGAFNPETGEINWDCPCLGGMAHGPCGMQFREAFSCFVFSEKDPKGIDCVEKFKAMQDCFREHPEVYADDIMDDDEEVDTVAPVAEPAPRSDAPLDATSSEEPAVSPAAHEDSPSSITAA